MPRVHTEGTLSAMVSVSVSVSTNRKQTQGWTGEEESDSGLNKRCKRGSKERSRIEEQEHGRETVAKAHVHRLGRDCVWWWWWW
ncbi:hypothetical protein K504DRAFT_141131 [Pleomassaria siparia CBS 279.74]|uniref:Uncharacterized protein n=1 Tax=Pleomassaria siparia CBS 279.74 TaxID=1314801 RepID=A0A6G1KL13_9PLEO|nr:hypothetical protein K504DRAFT_141131 [Pleomassaria siparia CBS 279.74]